MTSDPTQSNRRSCPNRESLPCSNWKWAVLLWSDLENWWHCHKGVLNCSNISSRRITMIHQYCSACSPSRQRHNESVSNGRQQERTAKERSMHMRSKCLGKRAAKSVKECQERVQKCLGSRTGFKGSSRRMYRGANRMAIVPWRSYFPTPWHENGIGPWLHGRSRAVLLSSVPCNKTQGNRRNICGELTEHWCCSWHLLRIRCHIRV